MTWSRLLFGSGTLDHLEFKDERFGEAVEERIAIVESGCDESVDECFSGSWGKEKEDAGDIAQMDIISKFVSYEHKTVECVHHKGTLIMLYLVNEIRYSG